MEHRGHADHRTLFPREEAGGRGRDRSCEPHGDGLCLAQHRPAKRPGQGAQTRPGRNHDLLARNRGNDLVRDGTAGGCHRARPHGAVAAPRRADRRHGAHHAVRRMGAHRMARGRRSERHRNGLRLPPQGRHGVARGTRRRDRGRNLPRETRRPRPRNDLRTASLLRHGPQRRAGNSPPKRLRSCPTLDSRRGAPTAATSSTPTPPTRRWPSSSGVRAIPVR